jgi:hypothetical protein
VVATTATSACPAELGRPSRCSVWTRPPAKWSGRFPSQSDMRLFDVRIAAREVLFRHM